MLDFFRKPKLKKGILSCTFEWKRVVTMLQPRLTSVVPTDNYTLLLTYETGEKRKFDVKPYITGR